MIKKAVFLAGGVGSRFQPLSRFIPKELVLLCRTPLIGYLLEEIYRAGVLEVVLISSPGKEALDRYFTYRAGELRLTPAIVYQDKPLGTADAIWRVREIVGEEQFFLYYSADLFLPKVAKREIIGLWRSQQLLAAYLETASPVLSLRSVPISDVSRFGIVAIDRFVREGELALLSGIVEKPDSAKAPSLLASIGGMILDKDVFWAINEVLKSRSKGSEAYLSNALNLLLQEGKSIYGQILLDGEWVDVGTLTSYPTAFERVVAWELERMFV
ncbi:MAG: UTP--glucose-1-phosphate uridylyltransferase GalU [Patescibacteria group bacterium]|nr:MAG: UTP--glucose-1-phosphate uridylyltransferase GalU [Patescibacteria group bacterium]